jgi:hypothetical protein
MNDFDQFLEIELRHILDPVVATSAPTRRSRRTKARMPILAVEASIDLTADATPAVEPVPVTVPVAASHL